jgi:hypothetical protein
LSRLPPSTRRSLLLTLTFTTFAEPDAIEYVRLA